MKIILFLFAIIAPILSATGEIDIKLLDQNNAKTTLHSTSLNGLNEKSDIAKDIIFPTEHSSTDRVSKSYKRAKTSASAKSTSEKPRTVDISQLVGLGLNLGGSLIHPYTPPSNYPYNPYTQAPPTPQPFQSYPFVFASPYIPNNPYQQYYTSVQTPMFGVGGQLGFQQSIGLGSTYPTTPSYYPTTYPPSMSPQQQMYQQQLLQQQQQQQQQQQLLMQQLQQQQQWQQQQWQLTTQPPNCNPNINYFPPTYGPTNSPPRPITMPENNYNNNYNNNNYNSNNNPDDNDDGQYNGSYESNITPPSNSMYGFDIRFHSNNTIASTVAAANGQNWSLNSQSTNNNDAAEKHTNTGLPTRRPIIGLPTDDDDDEVKGALDERIGVNVIKSLVG